MTDVAVYQDPTFIDRSFSDVALQRLADWAHSATAAQTVAEQLVKTSFVPEAFRGKPYEATAAILAGLECGLSPMAALRSFDVIQGQAAPRALTLRAIVQSHGHQIEVVESSATRCKMRGKRRNATAWMTVDWTLDRARSLGLLNKNNWKTQPQAMLIARATSELARLVAADAILGIGYSVEEIADGAGAGVEPPITVTPGAAQNGAQAATASPPGTKRMTRKRPTEPAPETPIEDADVVTDEDTITGPQMAKLRACYGEIGIKGAADQKRVTALILGVDKIDTHSNLTVAQASTVIDVLVQVEEGTAELVLNEDAEITGITIHDTPTLDLEGDPE